MPKVVRINKHGQVVALDNPVKVSKNNKDDLLWVALENGGPWTITFGKVSNDPSNHPVASGSPFSQNTYEVDKGGSNGSTGGPSGAVGRTYRYSVADKQTGKITHDPDVDVES